MPNIRLLPWLLAASLPWTATAADGLPASFDEAKLRADHDEAALPPELAGRIHQAQATALDAGIAQCAMPHADTSPFTLVVALDAQGTVTSSWRAGDTPLAICMEKFLRTRPLPAPPKAPLLVSYELSFTR